MTPFLFILTLSFYFIKKIKEILTPGGNNKCPHPEISWGKPWPSYQIRQTRCSHNDFGMFIFEMGTVMTSYLKLNRLGSCSHAGSWTTAFQQTQWDSYITEELQECLENLTLWIDNSGFWGLSAAGVIHVEESDTHHVWSCVSRLTTAPHLWHMYRITAQIHGEEIFSINPERWHPDETLLKCEVGGTHWFISCWTRLRWPL